MRKQEIETILKAAKGGDIDQAIAAHLGLEVEFKHAGNKVPAGCHGSFGAIRHEVEQWHHANAATRKGIDKYKSTLDQHEKAAAAAGNI